MKPIVKSSAQKEQELAKEIEAAYKSTQKPSRLQRALEHGVRSGARRNQRMVGIRTYLHD